MSEQYLDLSVLARGDAATDAEREAQHEVLASLLAAHADRELPAETSSQIDAHLLGCARCRREVEVQRRMRDAARATTADAALPDASRLEERLRARMAALPRTPVDVPAPAPAPERQAGIRAAVIAMLALSVIIVALIVVPVARRARDGAAPSIALSDAPVLAEVSRDYARTMSAELPGRARDVDAVRAAMPFAVEPLHVDGLRLLATWTTVVGGQPAAVFAYRWNDRIMLQYVIAEELLFRSPELRAALAASGHATYGDGKPALLAWALPEAGSVLVGEVTPAALRGLWSNATGR